MSALPPPFLPPGQQHAGCATLQPGGAGASSAAAGQRRGAAPRQAGGGWQQAAGAARGAHLAVRARAEHLQAAVVARLQPDVVRVHLQPPRHSENAQARRRCLCRLHWDLADSARSLGMQGGRRATSSTYPPAAPSWARTQAQVTLTLPCPGAHVGQHSAAVGGRPEAVRQRGGAAQAAPGGPAAAARVGPAGGAVADRPAGVRAAVGRRARRLRPLRGQLGVLGALRWAG